MSYWIDSQSVSSTRDKLFSIIENFRRAFPDQFKKTDLKICPKCEGSGLPAKKSNQEITFWRPGNYCDQCFGFGVLGLNRIYDEYLCPYCHGAGCEKCNKHGTVDWIKNITLEKKEMK